MLGYGDGVIFSSTVGELLGYRFGSRNKIELDEGTELGSPDSNGIILGSTHLPHLGQTCHAYIYVE